MRNVLLKAFSFHLLSEIFIIPNRCGTCVKHLGAASVIGITIVMIDSDNYYAFKVGS